MRLKEFKLTEDQLLELKMSPAALAKKAGSVNAITGIEFEMYVPNIGLDNGEYNTENYDNDPTPESIDEVIEFYDNDGENYNDDLDSVKEQMENDYREWLYEQANEKFQSEELTLSNLSDYIEQYVRDNFTGDDEDLEDEIKAAQSDESNIYTVDAFEQYTDENRDDFETDYFESNFWTDQAEWFREKGYREMSDVARGYDLTWPHYDNAGEGDLEALADDFSQIVDSPVKYNQNYHGASRDNTHYIIEPDSSLDSADDTNDSGIEFISPPLPLQQMIEDLKKIKQWAGEYGCYTNHTCGLHMNVSLADIDQSNLDYVKLALFVGENYILDQFGRVGNNYCQMVVKKFQSAIRLEPQKALNMFALMKKHLSNAASKIIHSGYTAKYDGLNLHDNYLEFRYAGNDWLSYDIDRLVNTINRFVTAYAIACDPNVYKEEYAKKLYKMISTSKYGDDDVINYFARFSAGDLPRSALSSFVRAHQQRRAEKKELASKKEYRYLIKAKPEYQQQLSLTPTGAVVLGTNEVTAVDKLKNLMHFPSNPPFNWFDVVKME